MGNNNQISVLERFQIIFNSTGLSKKEFADLLEVDKSQFHRYITGQSDLYNLTEKLIDLGYSVDWMYTGEGEMILNKEDVDYELSYLNKYDKEKQKDRIDLWIRGTFGSIENFASETNLEPEFLRKYLYEEYIINYDIIQKLRFQGCNMLWTITGNGDMFTDTKYGQINYNRYLDNKKGNLLK